jgi:hypothetical protein
MRRSPVGISTSPAVKPFVSVVMVAAVTGRTAAANPSGSLGSWGVMIEGYSNKACCGRRCVNALRLCVSPDANGRPREMRCRFWLAPLELAQNDGFAPNELNRIRRLIEANRKIISAWHEHCD